LQIGALVLVVKVVAVKVVVLMAGLKVGVVGVAVV
jgi:hypothetical protein